MIDTRRAKELLSQLIIKNQSIDLNTVRDLDGKTLLHLACRYDWTDWCSIIQSLIEEHHCNVSAVDEDGNTPLHDAYQCGNYLAFSYLLALPSCKPDAVNKHDYTVLRMALETNDKRAVRELLSTGRVDPRSGTQRGHTYGELLEVNSLLPREQDYGGSALQMVEQLAECIEVNSRVTPTLPSYKHYFLLGTLQKIFKNRQQILISGLITRIKENMLPLPENPTEVYNLLVETWSMVDSFCLSSETEREMENVEIIAGKGGISCSLPCEGV